MLIWWWSWSWGWCEIYFRRKKYPVHCTGNRLVYIKVETLYGSVWGLAKWRSNFAFSIFFLPLSLSFSISICAVMVPSIFTFQFSIKKWEYTIWLIHQYFILFLFLVKFHTFLTTHNFEKSLCSRNFLSTILQTVLLFFQRRPFSWRNCINAILLCTTLSSSISLHLLFPLFFLFHLPYNQTRY